MLCIQIYSPSNLHPSIFHIIRDGSALPMRIFGGMRMWLTHRTTTLPSTLKMGQRTAIKLECPTFTSIQQCTTTILELVA